MTQIALSVKPTPIKTYKDYVVISKMSYKRILEHYGANKECHPPQQLMDKLLHG